MTTAEKTPAFRPGMNGSPERSGGGTNKITPPYENPPSPSRCAPMRALGRGSLFV